MHLVIIISIETILGISVAASPLSTLFHQHMSYAHLVLVLSAGNLRYTNPSTSLWHILHNIATYLHAASCPSISIVDRAQYSDSGRCETGLYRVVCI
jgi:hypothetical protein